MKINFGTPKLMFGNLRCFVFNHRACINESSVNGFVINRLKSKIIK